MKYLELVKDGWQALSAGKVVADPAAWKKKQVSVNQVAAALGALVLFAKVAGYDLHMDNQTQLYVAGGVYGLVNWVLTVVTTDKIGAMGQQVSPAGDAVSGRSGVSAGDATMAGPSGDVASNLGGSPGAQVGGVAAVTGETGPMRVRSDDPAQSDQYAGGA